MRIPAAILLALCIPRYAPCQVELIKPVCAKAHAVSMQAPTDRRSAETCMEDCPEGSPEHAACKRNLETARRRRLRRRCRQAHGSWQSHKTSRAKAETCVERCEGVNAARARECRAALACMNAADASSRVLDPGANAPPLPAARTAAAECAAACQEVDPAGAERCRDRENDIHHCQVALRDAQRDPSKVALRQRCRSACEPLRRSRLCPPPPAHAVLVVNADRNGVEMRSTVEVDGVPVGETPYNGEHAPGAHTLRVGDQTRHIGLKRGEILQLWIVLDAPVPRSPPSKWPWAIVTTGAVTLVVGGGSFYKGNDYRDEALREPHEGGHAESLLDSANDYRAWGRNLMVTGAVAVVAGVVWLLMNREEVGGHRSGPDGSGVTIRF